MVSLDFYFKDIVNCVRFAQIRHSTAMCTRMVMIKFKEGKTGGLEKHSQDFNMKLT